MNPGYFCARRWLGIRQPCCLAGDPARPALAHLARRPRCGAL